MNEEQITYFVGDDEAGQTAVERLRRTAIKTNSPLTFASLTNQEARKKFVEDDDQAAGVFLHMGGDVSGVNPIDLAKDLKVKGYKIFTYTGGGAQARKQVDVESGLGKGKTVSRWDLESVKDILEIGMKG